ncbi:MAG: hypothetical protein RLZZ292_2913 [Bacteroidota bacterium]|jgi:hypothetical protein
MPLNNYISALKEQKTQSFEDEKIRKFESNDFQMAIFCFLQKIFALNNTNNYQIIIPDRNYQDDITSTVVLCTALTKYFSATPQEFNEITIQAGDYVYNYDNNRVYKFIRKQENKWICTIENQNNADRQANTEVYCDEKNIRQCVILKNIQGYIWNRETRTKFKAYLDFFKEYTPQETTFKALTKFNSKSLIISEKSVIDRLENIPYRYNFGLLNLPIEPMIEIVKNWEEAEKILKNDDKIEEIIIIGKKKYQDQISNIINFKNGSNSLKKIILIGSEKANTNADFVTWHWTLEEVNLLSNVENNFLFLRKSIKEEALTNALQALQNIENELVVKGLIISEVQSTLRNLFAPFQRIVTKLNEEQANKRLEIVKNDLVAYDKNFQIICDNANFGNALKNDFKEKILNVFVSIIGHFKSNNSKLDFAFNMWKNEEKSVRIVTDNRYCEQINVFIKQNKDKIRRTKAISVKDFEDIILGKKTIDNPKGVHFVFSYIYLKYENPSWYYYLLQKAKSFGTVTLLQYEGIEEQRNDAFEQFYKKENLKRLTSVDRLKFVNFEFKIPKEEIILEEKEQEVKNTIEEEIRQNKDFFARFLVFDEDIKNKRSAAEIFGTDEEEPTNTIVRVPHDTTQYEITFNDGTKYPYNGSYPFALVNGGTPQRVDAKNLKNNDNIIHFNINFDACFAILRQIKDSEIQSIVKEIITASKEWRTWLRSAFDAKKRQLQSEEKAKNELYKKIDPSVSQTTFNNWLTNNEEYFFPKANDDLKKILDYYPRIKPEEERSALQVRANKIFELKQKNTGLREVVTKLDEELIIYFCDNNLKNSLEILSKLTDNQIDTLIKTKSTIKVLNTQRL